eukprot:5581081-Prymnesium_polylepis.2
MQVLCAVDTNAAGDEGRHSSRPACSASELSGVHVGSLSCTVVDPQRLVGAHRGIGKEGRAHGDAKAESSAPMQATAEHRTAVEGNLMHAETMK